MSERRAHKRKPASVAVKLGKSGQASSGEGLTVDVSRSGFQLVLPPSASERFTPGDEVPFEIEGAAGRINGVVRVVRVEGGGYTLGLEFTEGTDSEALSTLVKTEPEVGLTYLDESLENGDAEERIPPLEAPEDS